MVIQQMSTNCVQTNDDSTPVSLCLSFFHFVFFAFFSLFLSLKTRNLSQIFTKKRQKKIAGYALHPLLPGLRSSPGGC